MCNIKRIIQNRKWKCERERERERENWVICVGTEREVSALERLSEIN